MHPLESLKVLSIDAKPSKASLNGPYDLILMMISHSKDIYSIFSSTFSIIISEELPPDKKKNLFKIQLKNKIGVGWLMSNFGNIVHSFCTQILLQVP